MLMSSWREQSGQKPRRARADGRGQSCADTKQRLGIKAALANSLAPSETEGQASDPQSAPEGPTCPHKGPDGGAGFALETFADGVEILGAIFLPGNRVIEHPSNGEEAGKFLFEVVPGAFVKEPWLRSAVKVTEDSRVELPNQANGYSLKLRYHDRYALKLRYHDRYALKLRYHDRYALKLRSSEGAPVSPLVCTVRFVHD
ncbi:hypothetical protein P4O66_002938 [Electrophorus voltai]|uniref:Uncharacterized protein n=1 Tax=Electrophorus voltai TaxID=2609070 RepID=A0AAD8YV40_9TELE|nr:hypothetical protein P4O66_002938 [Electrophorus voltai]